MLNNSQEITKDMITGALNANVSIDNRLLLGFMNAGKEVVKDKDGKPIQKGVDKDGNPIYETRDINGFQSIGSDFKNFGDNFTGALVGATGSVINTIKTTYDTITDSNSSITDVAKNWKTGQNSLATSIMRGTDDKTKDIMEKINKGTATPEELQYVSNMVSKDGDGNIIFTSEGKSIIVKDADGRIGEQLGFNDKTTGQGYVDAGKTATDAKTFMKVDAEERIHKNIESESVAKNMANREVGYYNTISFLTGGKGLAVSNTTNGGLNSQMQSNWNQQYNTSTSSLLANNTSIASNVNDKLYSVFVDEKGKILKVTNNDNYNAYKVSKGTTREDIEKDPEKYENENNTILYSDLFLKDEKLSGENLTLAEKSFNNEEVHNELLLLDSFDKNKSISENISNLLSDGKIDTQTAIVLQRAVGNGADDNKLLYNLNPNLYGAFDSLNMQSNPMITLSNSFGLELNNQTFISATGTEPRGCDNAGCGYFGSSRGKRSHLGLDLKTNENSIVFAPQDGVVIRINNVYTIDNGSLNAITINSSDGKSKLYYVEPKSYINIGTNVKQGDILGNGQDLATGSPKRHGGSNPTPNHVHQEVHIDNTPKNPLNYINNKK